jgi:hypothetical protein
MSVQLTYSIDNQNIIIVLDASLREEHSAQAEVTQHPVETGPNITDNIRPMPMRLTIEGFVTNTPIKASVLLPTGNQSTSIAGQIAKVPNTNAKTLQFSTQFDRVSDVYEDLLDAQAAGVLIAVDTSLKHYVNFAISSVDVPRDAQSGSSMQFTIELQQIITATLTEVETAPTHQEKNNGQKPTKEATAKEEAQVKESFGVSAAKALGLLK